MDTTHTAPSARISSGLPDILTVEEVAQYLQIGTQEVYRLRYTGKLNGVKLSHKTLRFSREDLLAFVRESADVVQDAAPAAESK